MGWPRGPSAAAPCSRVVTISWRSVRGAVVASPLLRTKLFVPRPRPGLVPRPALTERLSRTPQPRLTLVSAPPGFGKTTLLASWLAASGAERPVAWVSLEENERHPDSFWTYVVTALDTAAPGVGATALPLLQAPQPPIEAVIASVLNELSALPAGLPEARTERRADA